MFESSLLQHLINKLLVLHVPVLGLALLQQLLHLLLAHRHSVRPQVVPQLADEDTTGFIGIEDAEALHKFLLHGHLALLVDLNRGGGTTRAKKSAKSILDETSGLSDLMALSPNASTTEHTPPSTLLLAHHHAQDPQHPRHVLRLHVPVLLLVETVEDLSVFLHQLRAHSRLQLGHRLLLDLGRRALHYITSNYYKQEDSLWLAGEGKREAIGGDRV
jgi:hypothetical protein